METIERFLVDNFRAGQMRFWRKWLKQNAGYSMILNVYKRLTVHIIWVSKYKYKLLVKVSFTKYVFFLCTLNIIESCLIFVSSTFDKFDSYYPKGFSN